MKVVVHGQGEVTLTQADFVAKGGEGSVYAKRDVAYKVYADPSRALPVGKITELAAIADRNVIKPERVLLDPRSNTPVGYTMRFVRDTLPLCGVFTRAFREREGLDHRKALGLVRALQALVENVHRAGILIVDLNEMNFLVDRAFTEVYGIDVDSYQTRSYHATALMPSVKDWSVANNDHTELSDWFSFACVAFNLFTGIHPYKGKHPTVQGLDERMKANLSVFDPAVTTPKVVYPFDVIPAGYRAWFKAVLQDGRRVPPPADPGSFVAAVVAARTVVGGDTLDISTLFDLAGYILGYTESGGTAVTWTADGVYLGGRLVQGPTNVRAVAFTPKGNRPVVAWVEGGTLRLRDVAGLRDVPTALAVDDVMGHGGRVYVRSGVNLIEVVLNEFGNEIIASPRVALSVAELSTKVFDGVVLQDLVGSTFVSVFPQAGVARQLRVPELDTYRVTDARCDGRVLMVVGAKAGKYDRLVFDFDEGYGTHTLRHKVEDVTPAGLNFITLDNGVVVHLTEDEDLEVRAIGTDKVKVVNAKVLGNDMRLVKHGGRVAFVRGNSVSTMRMK